MRVGIGGLPRCGKTTLFLALAGEAAPQEATRARGPGGRTKPLTAVVKVPDERLDRLSKLYTPRKTTYAEVAFVDLPGPVAASGEEAAKSFDAQSIAEMREADALCLVLRGFPDPASGAPVTPVADVRALETELTLADLVIAEKRAERLRKDHSNPRELESLETCLAQLEAEKPLRDLGLSADAEKLLSGFRFLTLKPVLLCCSTDEAGLRAGAPPELLAEAQRRRLDLLTLAGAMEAEIAALPAAEQRAFLDDLGVAESARDAFLRAAYALLDLVSFFTVGEDECRAWTVRRGTVAQRAAGKIHSDLERGFIRAEVTRHEDLLALGSEARCREAAKLRLEGKEYVVQDGDVMHVRFSV